MTNVVYSLIVPLDSMRNKLQPLFATHVSIYNPKLNCLFDELIRRRFFTVVVVSMFIPENAKLTEDNLKLRLEVSRLKV